MPDHTMKQTHALHILGSLALLFLAACDDTSTSTYTECYQDQVGNAVYESCCTTTCEYDDSCYYYYGGDCDASCTRTCYNNSATPVSTAIYITPSIRLSTPTPTPTPMPAMIRIDVGSAAGRPGAEIAVTVSLVTSGASVAATGNDISFDPSVLGLDPGACQINAAIGKSLIASVLPDDAATKTLRIFVSSSGNSSPIPDGALYTCTFAIAPSALPGTYQIGNSSLLAFGPDGTPLNNVVGANGSAIVSLVVPPSLMEAATPVRTPCVGDCSGSPTPTATPMRRMRWSDPAQAFQRRATGSPQGSLRPFHLW